MAVSLQKLFTQRFEGHRGRPGQVGGSLPRNSGSYSTYQSVKEDPSALSDPDVADRYIGRIVGEWVATDGRSPEAAKMLEYILPQTAPGGYFDVFHPGEVTLYRGGRGKGLRSWTTDRKVAEGYGNITSVKITKDTPAFSIDKFLGGSGKSEYEVIFRNGELFTQKSGHFGHKGRIGKIGGSLPSGTSSVQYREFTDTRKGDTRLWGEALLDEANLTNVEHSSVYEYKGDSNPINEKLRNGKLFPEDLRDNSHIKTLDRAIAKSKLPEPVLTFRGINRNVLGPETGDYTGIEFQDNGFVSSTLHIKSALGWSWMNGDPVGTVVQIQLPQGHSALYADEIYDRGEYELLLPRDMKFRVTKDETVERFGTPEPWRLLTVEVIP